jgi:hypothetical protein
VLFIEPGATTNVFHDCVVSDALLIDVRLFVAALVEAASTWESTVRGTTPYESNRSEFVTRYPTGLSPYIQGVPVIG